MAVEQRLSEMLLCYPAFHPSYADSVNYDLNETQTLLERICSKPSGGDVSILHNFSFNPLHDHVSLLDLWTQARVVEANLGAGEHKPLDTITRGKIYKETTLQTSFNIDHIFGATPAQVETWAVFVLGRDTKAGNPALGYYEVVAGSTTLPCATLADATHVMGTKDKKRKKDFVKVHPELESVLGMSWDGALA